ncbi:DUF4913 domain-containing protein [Arthrobacter sp. ZBG10]|uniref:DUF4913 domain-containing protein n=1 Tax=Arthrobacter sp. ZBG10 TaxID=1676590 RepID=UPI0009E239CB
MGSLLLRRLCRWPEGRMRMRSRSSTTGRSPMSAWWIQHWDPQARTLFSGTGPFKGCQRQHAFLDRAQDYTPRLVTVAPPADWMP